MPTIVNTIDGTVHVVQVGKAPHLLQKPSSEEEEIPSLELEEQRATGGSLGTE